MKITVIGNSHTAAWKLGWDKIAGEHPDVEMRFFAQRGSRVLDVDAVDGCLVPRDEDLAQSFAHTSGGHRRIDLNDCDEIVVCGLLKFEIFNQDKPSYSQALFDVLLRDSVQFAPALALVKLLRQVTDKPIWVVHNPLRALPEEERVTARIPYARAIARLNDEIFAPNGAVLMRQPAKTLLDDVVTMPRFLAGRGNLDVGDGFRPKEEVRDLKHMNAQFGALAIRNLFTALRNRTDTPTASETLQPQAS